MAIISFFEVAAIAMAIDQEINGEVNAAIALALHKYMDSSEHDTESHAITIRRRPARNFRQPGPQRPVPIHKARHK